MRTEIINGRKCIIGAGEDSCHQILQSIYPTGIIKRQVLLSTLCKNPGENMSERFFKETVDLVVHLPQKTIAFRVNGKDHRGDIKGRIDARQKEQLEDEGIIVVDLPIRDCPILFKEKVNDDSKNEVIYHINKATKYAKGRLQVHNAK